MHQSLDFPLSGPLFRFQAWVYRFCQNHQLINHSGEYMLAVSTGADSMALLALFHWWRKLGLVKSFEVSHVNHGTRSQCIEEEQFLVDICAENQIKLYVDHLHFSSKKRGDFERKARDARYAFFDRVRKKHQFLVTGHHLDDSFEWHLMQSFKSSNLEASLGIPVRNGHTVRPLMCVSRSQIEFFLKQLHLKFFNDESNQDTSYLRNYIRHEIVPKIRQQFPNYLKNYVHRSNALARKWQVHMVETPELKLVQGRECAVCYRMDGEKDFQAFDELFRREIHRLSNKNRGSLTEQLNKLKRLTLDGKEGPLLFPGGVQVYGDGPALFFTGQGFQPPQRVLKNSAKFHIKQFRQWLSLMSELKPHLFPFWVVVSSAPHGMRGRRRNHPFLPLAKPRDGELVTSAFDLLKQWSNKRDWSGATLAIAIFDET